MSVKEKLNQCISRASNQWTGVSVRRIKNVKKTVSEARVRFLYASLMNTEQINEQTYF